MLREKFKITMLIIEGQKLLLKVYKCIHELVSDYLHYNVLSAQLRL